MRLLPPDHAERWPLHNEVHALPSAHVDLPAWGVYVAVLNAGVSRAQAHAHLRQSTDQPGLWGVWWTTRRIRARRHPAAH